jgi:hypothetical protein
MKGLRLSLRWFDEKPPVPRSSDIPVVPGIPRTAGVMTSTSPEPEVGRGSPPMWAERESSLADPHGGPAATDKKYFTISVTFPLFDNSFRNDYYYNALNLFTFFLPTYDNLLC